MKFFLIKLLAVIGIAASLTLSSDAQDHGHLNVGATGTNQNSPLTFDNGDIFGTDSEYVSTLVFTNGGRYAGFYNGNITLTALATTTNHAGPVPNAPASGSFIFAQLVSVDGPVGGQFAFWENGATNPTIALVTGTTGTNTWVLSENNGVAGTDPFGHFHGRRFTATKPGIYTVGFRAFDFSTNGVDGEPIHTNSDVLRIYFQAGITITSVRTETNQTRVRFGAKSGSSWQLQWVGSPTTTNWQATGDSATGNDYFQEVTDTNAPVESRFYRVKASPIIP